MKPRLRLYYLDDLRVFLTMLVIVHHTSITYGAGGSWYFEDVDKAELTVTSILLTLFTAVNQAFFMGFFFFLSGYFTPLSYDRKGAGKFLADRFVRLGIPLIAFVFLLGPFTSYIA
jgi:glucans biosynthesis protein C